MQTDNSSQLNKEPDNQEDDGYLAAARNSFFRIWSDRFLWFWGIFLPSGFFYAVDLYSSPAGHPSGAMPAGGQAILELWKHQLRASGLAGLADNLEILMTAAIFIFFFLMIGYWIMSALARAGVIRTLDQIQNNIRRPDYGLAYVWRHGRPGMANILKLDVVILGSLFAILMVLITPIAFISYRSDPFGAIILSLVAFIIFAPMLFLGMFLRNMGAIQISLAKQGLANAIEVGYLQLVRNLGEAIKLYILVVSLSVLQMFVVVSGLGLLFTIFSTGLLLAPGLQLFIQANQIWGSSLLALVGLAVYLWIRSIFALWTQDLWLWWSKKFGGIKAPEPAKEERKKVLMEKTEPAVGA